MNSEDSWRGGVAWKKVVTELTSNRRMGWTELSREISWEFSLIWVLLLVCVTPVLAEGKNSESITAASQMLEDPSLHKQSALRFSRVYSFVAELEESELSGVLEVVSDSSVGWTSERVRSELQIAILQRLANRDPHEALRLVDSWNESESSLFIRTIFETWAILDLDSAIGHARSLDEQVRTSAMLGLLDAQDETNLPKALNIGQELDLNEKSSVSNYVNWMNAEWVQDPKDTWTRLTRLAWRYRISKIQQLLAGLAIQWYGEEGTSMLDEIRALSNNDNSLQVNFSLRSVLKHIAVAEPRTAFDYARYLPNRSSALLEDLMRTWAEFDLQGALEASYAIGNDALRRDFQQEVASVWAEKEPRYILENLDVLPEPVRFVAARVGVGEVARSSLQEAGEYALQIEDLALRETAVSWLLPIWSTHEPSTLLDWLLSGTANRPIVSGVREQLVYNTVDSDPRNAFQLARGQPRAEWDRGTSELAAQIRPHTRQSLPPPVGLEAHIFERIAESDSQLALELLPDVREGETKFEATLHLGKALVYQVDVSGALNLAEQLPELHRDRYYSRLVRHWGREDPISLLASVEEFPSAKHQSSAAAFLLRSDRKHNTLNETQVKSLRQYLSDEDQIRVDWY